MELSFLRPGGEKLTQNEPVAQEVDSVIPQLIVARLQSEEEYKANHKGVHFGLCIIVPRPYMEAMVTPYHLQLTNG